MLGKNRDLINVRGPEYFVYWKKKQKKQNKTRNFPVAEHSLVIQSIHRLICIANNFIKLHCYYLVCLHLLLFIYSISALQLFTVVPSITFKNVV